MRLAQSMTVEVTDYPQTVENIPRARRNPSRRSVTIGQTVPRVGRIAFIKGQYLSKSHFRIWSLDSIMLPFSAVCRQHGIHKFSSG